jgi:hypothetical protein
MERFCWRRYLGSPVADQKVDGEAFLLFYVRFRWGGEDFGEPVVDAGDDLADAGLRDFEVFGDAVGGEEFDGVETVDFQVAAAGRQVLVAGG